MYNILFFSVVIIGLNTTLEEEPVASFMLQSFGIMVATFTGILVLFVPKIYIIFSGKLEDNGEDSAISTGTGNNSGTHSEVKKSARTSRLSKQASSENQRS